MALQWSFPQAYYSVYALTLAFFKATGYTEVKHESLIKRFGLLVEEGKYPQTFSFRANGCLPFNFFGVLYDSKFSALNKPKERSDIESHIALFLSGTRREDLKERKRKIKIKTKSGTRKKKFSIEDWHKVNESLGNTSLLSLLYRKRIKANYKDIETFLNPYIDGKIFLNIFVELFIV